MQPLVGLQPLIMQQTIHLANDKYEENGTPSTIKTNTFISSMWTNNWGMTVVSDTAGRSGSVVKTIRLKKKNKF